MNSRKTKAVLLMLISALSFSIMQIFVKLSSAEVPTFEQVFFRNLVSLIIAAFMVKREKLPVVREMRRGGWALLGRSFFGFLGIVLFFYATGHARQADVAMLNRASPVFVTLFAGIFLKEQINRVKIASTVLCIAGAYIAMQPSFDSNPLPLFSAFAAAAVAGLAYTLLAYCKNFVSPSVIIFHFSAFSTICAGVMMLPNFVVPSPKVFLMLLMIGIFAAGGQFLLTYAYKMAPASEVSIYQYSGVVFTAILSFIVLGESLSSSSIVGGLVILGAIFWVFEYHRKVELPKKT
ncbi:MAG: DMT family transporter [Oscillospiraceae bacterium]|nr:DMT family transporter [Oscillospiraceae bacterium]